MTKLKDVLAYSNPLILLGVPVTFGIWLAVVTRDSFKKTGRMVVDIVEDE